MKICRYDDNRFGIVRDDVVYDVTNIVEAELPAYRYPLPIGDQLIANIVKVDAEFVGIVP